jgi:hypothetical protein
VPSLQVRLDVSSSWYGLVVVSDVWRNDQRNDRRSTSCERMVAGDGEPRRVRAAWRHRTSPAWRRSIGRTPPLRATAEHPRAAGAAAAGGRQDQPCDRHRPGPGREDGRPACEQHLCRAGRLLARRRLRLRARLLSPQLRRTTHVLLALDWGVSPTPPSQPAPSVQARRMLQRRPR